MLTAPVRPLPKRLTGKVLVVWATALLLVVAFANPAAAEPGEDGGPAQATLRAALDKALGEYNDAKGRLDASVARQTKATEDLAKTKEKLVELEASAGNVASAAYRGKRLSMMSVVLDAGSPETLLHNAVTVQYMVSRDDRLLRELAATRKQLEEQQTTIADEVKRQQEQLAVMEKNKKAAEDALKKAGGGQTTSGAPTGGRVTAPQLTRNPDGSWPKESCSISVTSAMKIGSGCISPRMYNALEEARKAGFSRYTNCYRSGGGGDHPLGKACDFSANATTFVNARASGGDKTYGDNLAAWCVANASRMGVKYVIWWDRIWQPGSGWKSYGGDGTPAGDHYNHVHLSMQ